MRRNHLPIVVACWLLSAPAYAGPAEQRQEVTRSFDRTLAVSGATPLRIEHRHGDVRIRAHAGGELRILAAIRVSARSAADAQAFADAIAIDVENGAGGISVRTRYPEQRDGRRNVSFAVDYDLQVPERMPLDVHSSFGSVSASGVNANTVIVNAHGRVTVADAAGRHRLENSFGAIEVARVAGDVTIIGANGSLSAATIGGALSATNRFGAVTVTGVRGAAVVSNSNGQVNVTDAVSAHVTTSFGAAVVAQIAGAANVTNSNGKVELTGVKGAAEVRTTFGQVSVRDIGSGVTVVNSNGGVTGSNVAGTANVTTSFGTVDLRDVSGAAAIANSNGSVKLSGVGGEARVKTSFGLVSAERVGGALTVDNRNGGVQATGVAGAATVKTSFGPVTLREVRGPIDVRNQNGAVDVTVAAGAKTCRDISLSTTFSTLQVALPDAGYQVTARTSFGAIQSDIPITSTGTISERSLTGTIGAGGCTLQLTNANGNIRIVPAAR